MIAKLKITIASLLTLSVFAAPAVVMAQPSIQNGVCQGSTLTVNDPSANPDGAACANDDVKTTKVNTFIVRVINLFSIVVGAISVIMIIFGGFRYITSGGDSTKVNTSKNTILYAVIGLIIVALAQFIVQFVLAKSTNLAP